MIKVAINGFGRIGRLVFKMLFDDKDMEVVAINDLGDNETLAYLLKYDTTYGIYKPNDISYNDDGLVVSGRNIKTFKEMDPLNIPWKDMGADLVFECSGKFTNVLDAKKHITAGSKKVIVSAPCKGECKTIVYNVNHDIIDSSDDVISAASCTTNCLAPILKVINDNFGIKRGYMTTVHAYTNDQMMLDGNHKKGIYERRGRAGAQNIIPTSTGAAKAIGKVIPALEGKMEGYALRVPVNDGSIVDLVLELSKNVSVDDINKAFTSSQNETLLATFDPLVSSDIIGNMHGSVVDCNLTKVISNESNLIKVVGFYDNELGYTAQMIRTAKYFMTK